MGASVAWQCSPNRCLALGHSGLPVAAPRRSRSSKLQGKTWSRPRSEVVVPNKQILASEAVVETAGNAAFGFERIEDAELKGLPGPVVRLPSRTERAGLRSHTKLTGSIVVRGL
jgi:hypothetical protein